MNQARSFSIAKQVVLKAYKRVKKNDGVYGVDKISIKDFDEKMEKNLYKIWNRMSSGCYFPPAVREVFIPKKDGKKRPLGIPTVADRIAQMVVKMYLEPEVEPYFHPDSYGYRPNKSALDAIKVTRERSWRYDWVLEVDIQNFFDNIDHELMMKAVRKHTDSKWILLYIQRWLKAPLEKEDGTRMDRVKGTPQGGVISPLLANLFLHYAFDEWMRRNYSKTPFERYADDIIVHCKTEEEAYKLKEAVEVRFKQCKLNLHPEKTRIVYCKDDNRPLDYPNIMFDFMGYTFRPRKSIMRGGRIGANFLPAISRESVTRMCGIVRKWKIHLHTDKSLQHISEFMNPVVGGWINYYGKYYRTQLHSFCNHLNGRLVYWAAKKYKRFNKYQYGAWRWISRIAMYNPTLFAHWSIVKPSTR
jgi:RNA-directed DNA polymerase